MYEEEKYVKMFIQKNEQQLQTRPILYRDIFFPSKLIFFMSENQNTGKYLVTGDLKHILDL